MSDKPSLPMIWPSLIAAALGVYGYITYQSSLDSARPPTPITEGFPTLPSPPGLRAHRSRLWQDPLAVVYEEPAKDSSPHLQVELPHLRGYLHSAVNQIWSPYLARMRKANLTEKIKQTPNLIVMPVFVPGGLYGEDRERRMRMRYAVVSALSTCDYRPKHAARLSSVSLQLYVDGAEIDVPTCETVRIPLELYIGSVTEGLYEDNKPKSDEFEEPCEPCDECNSDHIGSSPSAPPKTPLLLLWIDESRLGNRPMGVLAQILHHMLRTKSECPPMTTAGDEPFCVSSRCPLPEPLKLELHAAVRVLGPSSSDMLLSMAYEDSSSVAFSDDKEKAVENPIDACREGEPLPTGFFGGTDNKAPYFTDRVRIYSPRATISPIFLREGDPLSSGCRLSNFTTKKTNSGAVLSRTVGSDLHLAFAIRKELLIRGIWHAGDRKKNSQSHIVLISERDTKYGRAIVDNFKQVLGEQNLTTLAYLRGVDGEIPQQNKSEKSSAEKREHDHDQSGRVLQDHVEPEGPSQLDYLHRLEQQLAEIKTHLGRSGKGRIAAIGVVGSDVFDKLIVLRAIREEFPRTIFFSTDVDANFSRETEYPTTRNVIVASHFGLQLHPDLQRDVPPFRNSYQTSMFLASLLAAGDARATKIAEKLGNPNDEGCDRVLHSLWATDEKLWRYKHPKPGDPLVSHEILTNSLRPLVYEIGRHGSYQLTVTGGEQNLRPKSRDMWKAWEQKTNLDVTAQVQPTSPRERWTRGESLKWTIVTMFTLLVFAFWLTAIFPPFQKLVRRLFKMPVQDADSGESKGEQAIVVGSIAVTILLTYIIWVNHLSPDGEPFIWTDGISIWPTTILHLAAIVMSVVLLREAIYNLRKNAKDICKEYATKAPLLGNLQSLMGRSENDDDRAKHSKPKNWWRFFKSSIREILNDHEVSPAQSETNSAINTIWDLLYLVLPAALLNLFAGILLFILFDRPFIPSRGDMSNTTAWIGIVVAYVCVVLLTTFVLINVRIFRNFAEHLTELETVEQAKSRRRTNSKNELNLEFQINTIQIIARRTDEVGKTLQYPFGVLLVMYVAQSGIIDCWQRSVPLFICWGFLIALLFWSALQMRRDAKKARDKVIRVLSTKKTMEAIENNGKTDKYEETIKLIQAERRGAYCPWSEDYLLRSLAIPLGGGSGWLLLQQWFL